MQQKLLFLSILLMSLVACNKEKASETLAGEWRLVKIIDKSAPPNTLYPPAAQDANLVLAFSNTDRYEGHTLRNDFTGAYALSGNDGLEFLTKKTSEVMEDEWGGKFFTVLDACALQSVRPCAPNIYTIAGNQLTINSPLRYDLIFKRIR